VKGLLVFLVVLAVIAFLIVPRLVAWLRTVQSSPVPVGYGGRAP
jgi:Tfp pilus assembly protein FimT